MTQSLASPVTEVCILKAISVAAETQSPLALKDNSGSVSFSDCLPHNARAEGYSEVKLYK